VAERAWPDLSGPDEVFRTLRAWQFALSLGPTLAAHPGRPKPALAANIAEGRRLSGDDLARAEIAGAPHPHHLDWMASAYLISATGHPALSVPAAFTRTGCRWACRSSGRTGATWRCCRPSTRSRSPHASTNGGILDSRSALPQLRRRRDDAADTVRRRSPMIREAELFVTAEGILLEVLGRIRDGDGTIELPPLADSPGLDAPIRMRAAVERYAREQAELPAVLAGESPGPTEIDLLGPDPHATVEKLADAACDAAREVVDGDTVLPATGTTVREHLTRLTALRCFLAHEVAIHLGSRACPLTEELAQGIWQLMWPDAEAWRERGIFREPMPLPDDVSKRDRFLLCAGRDPHPLHH
jgi:hypothetical protein